MAQQESKTDALIQKVDTDLKHLRSQILYFKDKDPEYAKAMSSWLAEYATKNRVIHHAKHAEDRKDKEIVRRRRSEVFFVDLGVGIGSELSYPHFCVVIKEFKHTAIVVPLSSVKDKEQPWKTEDNAYIEIGKIQNLPDEDSPDSYAVLAHMQSISKQRLSYFRRAGQYIKDLKLNSGQMDKLDEAIRNITTKEGIKREINE